MNMMVNEGFAAADGAGETKAGNETLARLMKAWESKQAKNVKRAGGLSLVAVTLAACGGSSSSTPDPDPEPDPDPIPDPDPEPVGPLVLTLGIDNIVGTDGDDVITAPVVQNMFGAITNTFETGDVVDGGDGANTMNITLITTGTVSDPVQSTPIGATVTNVQVMNFTVQSNTNEPITGANIDAGNMSGVQQWWSVESRATLNIDDIRSSPFETFFGMKDTDPTSNYTAYFNSNFITAASESSLLITVRNVADPADELNSITVDNITLVFNGQTYALNGGDLAAADTFAEFAASIESALAGIPELAGLQVTNVGGGLIRLNDPAGGAFGTGTVQLTTSANFAVEGFQAAGTEDLPVTTNVVLDNAGAGSQGGTMTLGAMSGDAGIEVFDVTVVSDSWLTSLISANLLGGLAGVNQLEVVNIVGDGDLSLGARIVGGDGRVGFNGLTDVQVVNAEDFGGALNFGLTLNNQNSLLIDDYFRPGDDPVEFAYIGSDSGNIMSVNFVTGFPFADPRFSIEFTGGASDDRFNLTFNQANANKTGFAIDGDGGSNTLEVNDNVGTAPATSWGSFDNIDTLVVAGNNATTQNFTAGGDGAMVGLSDVVVATGNVNTTLVNMEADVDLTISGKNQTMFAGNVFNNQNFGAINIQDNAGTDLGITLDNTARSAALNTGTLTVAAINIFGPDSAVANVDLTSAGLLDTVNTVQNFAAGGVTNVEVDGTQDLNLHVSNMAAAGGAAIIDATALDADMLLALNVGALAGNVTHTVSGPTGDDDTAVLYGAINNNVALSDFETVIFGIAGFSNAGTTFASGSAGATGNYNVGNAAGAGQFTIGFVAGGTTFTLQGLNAQQNNVTVGDATSFFDYTMTGTIGFVGTNTLNIDVESVNLNFGPAMTFSGFANVNLSLEDRVGNVDNYALFGGGDLFDGDIRNFTVDGGSANDTLFVGEALPGTIGTADFSGYAGSVTAFMADQTGTATEIVVGAGNLTFTMAAYTPAVASTWTEDNPGDIGTALDTAGVPIVTFDNGDQLQFEITLTDGTVLQTNFQLQGLSGVPVATAADPFNDAVDGAILQTLFEDGLTFTQGGNSVEASFSAAGELQLQVLAGTAPVNIAAIEIVSTSFPGADVDVFGAGTAVAGIAPDVSDYATTFTFTDGSEDGAWVIDNFIPAGDFFLPAGVATQLDLGDLGIGFGDANLSIAQVGADTVISDTTVGADNWTITLLGVDADTLTADNFV